jgi:hypothetical protein
MHAFGWPRLGVFNLELSAPVNDLESWINRFDLFNGMITKSADEKDVEWWHGYRTASW